MLATAFVIEPREEATLGFACTSVVCWSKGWLKLCHGLSVVLKTDSQNKQKNKSTAPTTPNL